MTWRGRRCFWPATRPGT
ncbi:unnamed protein product [Linum tenue]|uniref:Uncharacterized protein n=1 Tax=Linum tenue TaxID=586396 RepID=A0AAV0PRI5_9ROSI|nr:unnamed protein product [Linum tenue]